MLPGSRVPTLLDGFIAAMHAARPACIVDLGDRINSVATGQDAVRERYVRRRLEEAGVPVHHVLGNTDVERLPKHEALAAIKKGWPAETVDLEGLRLVLLDSLDPPVQEVGGTIGTVQLEWLRAVLAERPGPSLIFGHHPLDEPVLEGHHYFAGRPSIAAVQNRAEVRTVLQRAPEVAAVFSGHLHRTSAAAIRGIPYVTVGSLVDTAYTGGEPAGAYAIVTVGADAVEVHVAGRAPGEFRFRRPPSVTTRQ